MELPDEQKCPNCSGELPQPVTRKRACPSCKKHIHLEWNPDDDRRYAVTEEERAAFEKRRPELRRQRALQRCTAQAHRARESHDELGYHHHLGNAKRFEGAYGEATLHYEKARALAQEGRKLVLLS